MIEIAMVEGCRTRPSTTMGVSSLLFGRLADLPLGQFERDAVALVGDASEMQRIPSRQRFVGCRRREKPPENQSPPARTIPARSTITSDDAAHILIGRAADVTAEHARAHPLAPMMVTDGRPAPAKPCFSAAAVAQGPRHFAPEMPQPNKACKTDYHQHEQRSRRAISSPESTIGRLRWRTRQ